MNGKEYFKNHKPVEKQLFIELCRRVGANLDILEFKRCEPPDRGWEFPYEKYEWSQEEYKDFLKWLTNYLYKHRRAFEISYATKKRVRERIAPEWGLLYGWKFKKEESEDAERL